MSKATAFILLTIENLVRKFHNIYWTTISMTDFFAKKVVAEAAHKNSSVIDV